MTTFTLNLDPTITLKLSDEDFYRLCQVNRDLRLERTAEGELIIMPPTGRKIANGVCLGWLINPQDQQVEVYRPSPAVEILQSPTELFGEAILVQDLARSKA